MNGQFKILLYLLLVFGIIYFLQNKYSIFDISFNKPDKVENIVDENGVDSLEILNSEGQKIYVELEIADTDELRKLGLSNRTELGDYQGMLFVFDSEGEYSFWMKDMYLSLDMIFINFQGYITDIKRELDPCSGEYCQSIKSIKPFKYVLEVNGGFANLNRIEVGNAVIFDISSER